MTMHRFDPDCDRATECQRVRVFLPATTHVVPAKRCDTLPEPAKIYVPTSN